MVLTDKQKTVIENDFNEKGWNAYKIWKEHPSFECSCMAVHNLIQKIKETGSTEYHKGSGWPITTTTEENALIFEELVCLQEDEPGTHNSIRQIAPRISISKSSVHRLVKKKNLHCYKRLKTPQMNSACRKRRAELAGKLLQHFSIHSLPQLVFQEQKDFFLQVPTNQLLGPRLRESIRWSLLLSFRNDWWVEENNSPPNPQSNETVSLPFGSRWRKRRRLNQNCFWIDINKQIYLLNTLWLFSFFEIIVLQFSCNQTKLDRKRKFEIIFWCQNFHFLRV